MDTNQIKTLASVIGINEDKVFIKDNAVEHGHPVSACLRDFAETCIMRQCKNQRILDVGGSILRHTTRAQSKIHCCHSSSPHWKQKLDSWKARLPRGRKVTEECKSRGWVTYCLQGAENCEFKPDVIVSSDSLYYLTEEDYLKRAKSVAYAIFHNYPKAGTYLGGEHVVKFLPDAQVEVRIAGATEVYVHKQPKVTNHLIHVGGTIWKAEKIAKFGHYYVMKYNKQVNEKPRTAVSRTTEPQRDYTARTSDIIIPIPTNVVDDIRVPGQKTGAPPHPISDNDIQEWKMTGDWETTVQVLRPIASLLASHVTPYSIKDPSLIKNLYAKYDQLAKQYNIGDEIYAGMKPATVRVGLLTGIVNDLSIPRRFYHSWWNKAIYKVCSKVSRLVTGQALFEPDVDVATLMKQYEDREFDDYTLRRITLGVYGKDPFQEGALQTTPVTPPIGDWWTKYIVGLCVILGVITVFLLSQYFPILPPRRGGNAPWHNRFLYFWRPGELEDAIGLQSATTTK